MGKFRKVPSDVGPAMLAAWKQGLSQADIAKQFGVSPSRVSQILTSLTGWIPNNRRAWTENRKHRAIALYRAGNSQRKVADLLGTSTRHVKNVLIEAGIPIRPPHSFPTGSSNIAWSGGVTYRKGYRLIRALTHPHCTKAGYVSEHRLIMEAMLGRLLEPGEVVHHKNGDTLDNRPENLELFSSNGKHLAHELQGKCPKWSKDGLRRIKARWKRGARKL